MKGQNCRKSGLWSSVQEKPMQLFSNKTKGSDRLIAQTAAKCTQLNIPISAEEKAEGEHAEPWLGSFTHFWHSQANIREGEAARLHAIKKTWGLNSKAGSQLYSFAFPCP